jgi:hypothetical protein
MRVPPLALELDRRGAIRVRRPLAEVEGVRAPLRQTRAAVKGVMAAPATFHVFFVIRPQWGGTQPAVPIDDRRIRLGLGGQRSEVRHKAQDRSVDGVDFPKPSAAGQLGRKAEIRHIAPLGAGLEHAAVEFHRIGKLLGFMNRHAARLLGVNVLAGLRGENDAERMPVVASGRRW